MVFILVHISHNPSLVDTIQIFLAKLQMFTDYFPHHDQKIQIVFSSINNLFDVDHFLTNSKILL